MGARRWVRHARAGAAAVVTAWVVWLVAERVALASSSTTFNHWRDAYGSLAGRLVVAVVLVAVLAHTLDGARALVDDLWPERRHLRRLDLAVAYLLPALAIPTVVWLLWPALTGTNP